jgi:hypothetical protein
MIPTGTFFEAGESKEFASPYPLAEHRVEWQEGVNAEPAWTRVNAEPSQPADGTTCCRSRMSVCRITAVGWCFSISGRHHRVGGRFNGGELPTNVIIDRDGHLHRRFVGARDLAVFEAMVLEAAGNNAASPNL